MRRSRVVCSLPLLALMIIFLASCRNLTPVPQPAPLEGPDITPTRVDYVDTDGFDGLLENALVNQDPVIILRTGRTQPDWTGRLNAWIAAWNRGEGNKWPTRRAEVDPGTGYTARGQSPLGKVPFDGDSIREFRLLVTGLLDRTEDLAQSGSSWWAEERARSRRVALLKPYSLRFHKDEEELIQIVLFHGHYASYYPRFMRQLTPASSDGEPEWTRSIECSHCKQGKCEALLTSHHLDPETNRP